MEQRDLKASEATPRSMTCLPARKEQDKSNLTGEKNDSTTA